MMVEKVFLAVHVVAGILFVGPVAVNAPVAAVMHRITRTYARLALSVPAVGLGAFALIALRSRAAA
jgi:hypothetical protein